MIKKELALWLEAYKEVAYSLERYIPGLRNPIFTKEEFIDLMARDIYDDMQEDD